MTRRPPLITRLPRGLREQPAWVFIGVLLFLSGLGYLTGFTQSMITDAIGSTGLKVWGGVLASSGALLVAATMLARPSLEKLALRTMSLTLIAYAGYLMTVASLQRIAMSVILTVILVGLAEFRVMTLKVLIRQSEELQRMLEETGE